MICGLSSCRRDRRQVLPASLISRSGAVLAKVIEEAGMVTMPAHGDDGLRQF
jgi:hypothetical protein